METKVTRADAPAPFVAQWGDDLQLVQLHPQSSKEAESQIRSQDEIPSLVAGRGLAQPVGGQSRELVGGHFLRKRPAAGASKKGRGPHKAGAGKSG